MELWIRSQDKMSLSKINNIKLVEYNGEYSLVGYYDREVDDFDLGIYSVKERALEILDEIQYVLNAYIRNNGDKGPYERLDLTLKINMLSFVYEMPEK